MLIVGDRINGTVETVRKAVHDRDAEFIAGLASSQADAGADYIDVNVGTGTVINESESLAWALEVVRSVTDKPVSLDSSDPGVLEKGLELCGDTKPFVNSVNGDSARVEGVLPLASEYGCPVVALAMDESGIPETAEGRLDICRLILKRARGHGIPDHDIFFDPLVFPISTDTSRARVTLDTLALIKKELPEARTILGLSNVSFGLPNRSLLNRTLLSMAIFIGLDAALMDPTDAELRKTACAAEAVAGLDGYCRSYLKVYRSGAL